MSKNGARLLIGVFALLVIGIVYWEYCAKPGATFAKRPEPTNTASPSEATTPPKYAVESPKTRAAPSRADQLAQSPEASTFEEAVAQIIGQKAFGSLIEGEGLIHRLVVTAANEATPRVPPQFLPWHPVKGQLKVRSAEGKLFLDEGNYRRYRPYLDLLESANARRLVRAYARFYSSFQSDFAESSRGYFNDKAVAAIDDLLAAPVPKQPVELMEAGVYYHYADPNLEGLSAGQKLMIRIGPENFRKVKGRLAEFRELLTQLGSH